MAIGYCAVEGVGVTDPVVWQNLRVTVTGHTGFKGSWLTRWLSMKGAIVQGIALPPPTRPNLFESARLRQQIEHYICDIRDVDQVTNLIGSFRPDAVFHLAAQPLVRRSYVSPIDTYSTNVLGTLHVLEAARVARTARAVVVVTSDKCYENDGHGSAFRETDALGGHDLYSSSKACTEILAKSWKRSFGDIGDLLVATARAGNVIGGHDWSEDRLVPDLVRALTQGRPAVIRNPRFFRPWQHVLESLAGYLTLAERLLRGEGAFAEPWNFGPDVDACVEVAAFAETFCKVWGYGASWTSNSDAGPTEAKGLRLDSRKSRARLGWVPCLSLDEAIRWTVDSYRATDVARNMCQQIETYEARIRTFSKEGVFAGSSCVRHPERAVSDFFQISHCEVCESRVLIPVLNLGAQPLCDDLVPIGDTTQPRKYPAELLACENCLTVHQKYQIRKELLFPNSYHYRAALTNDVVAGMRDLVAVAEVESGGLARKVVLDIGCNDGTLLSLFRAAGATTIGIEPTDAANDAVKCCDAVINDFLGSDAVEAYRTAHPAPDIITFTNVFAHVEDLDSIIACVKSLRKLDTLVVIENHYLGAVLDKRQFDTFYHEHPRTYSFRSFQFIADKLGMNIVSVGFPNRYNGNIQIVLGHRRCSGLIDIDETGIVEKFVDMRSYIAQRRTEATARLRWLAATHGPLPAKAFPGRASILVNYFGIDESLISATYEKSESPKIGHYIPGTRIPILDERMFFADSGAPILVNLAWHIRDEIRQYVQAKGFAGKLVEIFH